MSTPPHLDWLVDTGERLKTADGHNIEVWEWSKATKVNLQEPSYDQIPPVNSDFFGRAMARRFISHRNSIVDGAFSELAVGTRVMFADEIGEKGAQATTVKLLGKHGLPV